METVANLRLRADRLRTFLQTNGMKVTKAIALEAQAAQIGVRDWNTLSALAKKTGDTPNPGSTSSLNVANPNFGYEHLAPYIGRKLPEKFSAGLKAEIDQIRRAVARGRWPWSTSNGVVWIECPHCQESAEHQRIQNGGLETLVDCVNCKTPFDLVLDIVVRKMLQRKDVFLLLRRDLCQNSTPILGYESFDNTAATSVPNGPLVIDCRLMAERFSYAIDLACFEFGLDKLTRDSAHLGYFISPEGMAESLKNRGVSDRQARGLGWLDAHRFATDDLPLRLIPEGLVVTFLPDPNGGPMSFWGYCPKAMRASQDQSTPLAYIVGQKYSKDAIFLGHLIDARPLVLVSGFMHAIALRQAGINAVAVPSFREMSDLAIHKILEGRRIIVVSGYDIQSNKTWNLECAAEALGVECRFMDPLSAYEGVEGFVTDRFVQDFRAQVADARTVPGKTKLPKHLRGVSSSKDQITSVFELAIEKFLVHTSFDGEKFGWTQESLDYVVVPIKQIRIAISQFVPLELSRQLRLSATAGEEDHPASELLVESLNSLNLLITEYQGNQSESCLWDVSFGVEYSKACVLLDKRRIAEIRPDIVPNWGITQNRIAIRKPTWTDAISAL